MPESPVSTASFEAKPHSPCLLPSSRARSFRATDTRPSTWADSERTREEVRDTKNRVRDTKDPFPDTGKPAGKDLRYDSSE
jgi:hypothetical protein